MKTFLILKAFVCCLLIISLSRASAQDFSKWEKEISAFEKADKADPNRKKVVLFIGSSSIRLWDNLEQYFPGVNVLNRGFGGSQTEDILHFADRMISPYNFKKVVVYVGENDLAAGKSVDQVFSDLKELFQKIRSKEPKSQIFYISVKPSPSRFQFVSSTRLLNEKVEAYLKDLKRARFIDVFSPMLNADGSPKGELFRDDQLHMKPSGYKIWADALYPYLN